MGRMGRLLAALLLLVTMTTGCSRLDWAVRFADTYVMLEADRFVDLSKSQRADAKAAFESGLKDVRREVFPAGADFLEEMAKALESRGADRASLDKWFERGQSVARTALLKFEKGSLDLALSMSKEQDENFAREFRERLDELRSETSTPEKLFKRDKKRAMKWTDMWVGSITREQEKKLDEFLRAHPTPIELQLKHRERLFAEFRAAAGDARKAWVKKFLTNPESMRAPDYDQALKARETALKAYLMEFWTTMTDTQKKTFFETLRGKAADLRRLSKVD